MKNIERRLNEIEKNLSRTERNRGSLTIVIPSEDPEAMPLPENLTEWLTYQEQMRDDPNRNLIILEADKEIRARKQQNATENDKEVKNND